MQHFRIRPIPRDVPVQTVSIEERAIGPAVEVYYHKSVQVIGPEQVAGGQGAVVGEDIAGFAGGGRWGKVTRSSCPSTCTGGVGRRGGVHARDFEARAVGGGAEEEELAVPGRDAGCEGAVLRVGGLGEGRGVGGGGGGGGVGGRWWRGWGGGEVATWNRTGTALSAPGPELVGVYRTIVLYSGEPGPVLSMMATP